MKTIYITLLTALFFTGNAQFTMLSKWHAPDSSSSHAERQYDSMAVIPKAMGAGLTWDFSAMKRGTATKVENFSMASTGTNVSLYPEATVVGKSGGVTSYYSTQAGEFVWLGDDAAKLSDSKVLIKWPVNFNSTWTDTYAGVSVMGPASGTTTGAGSGYGTVILPGFATYQNCMQVHTTEMVHVTGTTPATITEHKYMYYSQLQRFPLMTISYSALIDDGDTLKSTTVYVNELVAVGVTDYNFDASFAVYPNPASDHFTVKLSNENAAACEIQIMSVTGQLVKQIALGNSTAIEQNVSIDDLDGGIYLVKTRLGDRTSTRKLIVQ